MTSELHHNEPDGIKRRKGGSRGSFAKGSGNVSLAVGERIQSGDARESKGGGKKVLRRSCDEAGDVGGEQMQRSAATGEAGDRQRIEDRDELRWQKIQRVKV